MAFLVFVAILTCLGIAARRIGQVKPLTEIPRTTDSRVQATVDTNNPHFVRAFQMPAYGRVPANIEDLIRRVSPDQEEKVLAAVFVTREQFQAGYLVATTKQVHWIGTRPFRSHTTYPWGVFYRRSFTRHSPIIRMFSPAISAGGPTYYVRGFQKGRQFLDLLPVLADAADWAKTHNDPPTPRPVVAPAPAAPITSQRPLETHGLQTGQRVCVTHRCVLANQLTTDLSCRQCKARTQKHPGGPSAPHTRDTRVEPVRDTQVEPPRQTPGPGAKMAIVEFDHSGRTYRVDLSPYDSSNIHSINLIRSKVTLSEDTLTGDRLLVDWSQIAVMRIIS